MSVSYKAVGWNPFKKRYDLWLVVGVLIYILLFVGISLVISPTASLGIMLMRAFGSGSLILLHFILCIGPLARMDRRWLPVLYNRRHLGVIMFLMALFHAFMAVFMYHSGSDVNPFVSIFTTDSGSRMENFPFQAFGFVALLILFLMAATSHDFWLANLTAPAWKTLHMGVYVAYQLLIIHVAFGVLQAETHPVYTGLLILGFVLVAGLHLIAGARERPRDRGVGKKPADDGYVEICSIDEIPENGAKGVVLSGEKVAVVKYERKISALSGVCQHQNGPLAEGKFIDGCLTCPWHGYQYRCEDGASPPPFTEKVPTFKVRVSDGKVFVHPKPNPAGTPVEPARIS